MPHFVASSLDEVTYPNIFEDIKYNFEVNGENDSLISVSIKNKKFFLQKYKNAKMQTIVRLEKYTKLPQVWIMQKALEGYLKLSNAKIISQNIYKKNIDKENIFLYAIKDNDFFISFFKETKLRVSLEIGFGSGRHILKKAKENPDNIFIGLEVHYPSIEQVSKLAYMENIQNIYLHKCDARIFMELIPSNYLQNIFVHFPVPWDKKPHRRIYSKRFIKQAIRILDSKGSLELRTDSSKYYKYTKELFEKMDKKVIINKNKNIDISSKYEDRWRGLNKNIYDIVFINEAKSDAINNSFDFTFPKNNHDIKDISQKRIIYKKYFINFQGMYKGHSLDDKISLIKLSFGYFHQPINNYIQIKNGEYSYIIEPTASKYNIKSHKKITKLLNNA